MTNFVDVPQPSTQAPPCVELQDVSKTFGNVIALNNVSLQVSAGSVACVLGDNGAGKSTLIKVLAGVYRPDSGTYFMDGRPVRLESPRRAMDYGIATVYQDLAPQPLMPIWRAFFLGNEPLRFGLLNVRFAKSTVFAYLNDMGIRVRDVDQLFGTLSGGERQAVAIARAIYFGARVLILDEPTSALGVRQAGLVLRHILHARKTGVGVIFITHSPHHAHLVGDTFTILNRGRLVATYGKEQLPVERLIQDMAGGEDLTELSNELQELQG